MIKLQIPVVVFLFCRIHIQRDKSPSLRFVNSDRQDKHYWQLPTLDKYGFIII